MKNEVKLNIHMFYPEQLDKEISNNEHQALSKLLSLEYESLYSIEMFIAELKSRWTIIELITKEQTASFLGYTLSDIAKVDNFFAKKFEKFGMEAVEVQKILRNIWMKTPCEDKRLNYELFALVDNEFYEIVQERKKLISFKHISSPTGSSLEELKNNWEERRRHYAEQLQIDIDYLDNEAVDGNMFPSASGLFANPSPPDDHSDCSILEFLNFWMPHLYPSPFNPVFVMPSESIMPNLGKGNLYIEFIQDENLQSDDELNIDIVKKMSFIKHCEYVNSIFEKFPCSNKWLNAYKMYFKNIIERFGNWEKRNEKRFNAETNKVLKNALPELNKLVGIDELQKAYSTYVNNQYVPKVPYPRRPYGLPLKSYGSKFIEMIKTKDPEFSFQVNNEELQNSYKIWSKSKDIIYKHIKEYYCYFQPRSFYLLANTKNLPKFVNSCKEYSLEGFFCNLIEKRNLAFFSEGKVYFPNESILKDIRHYDQLFDATRQLLPEYPSELELCGVKQSLTNFECWSEEYYEELFIIRSGTFISLFIEESDWRVFISKINNFQRVRFYKLLRLYFEFFSNEKLQRANKTGVLMCLEKYFEKALSWSCGVTCVYGLLAQDELTQLKILIEKMIETNSEKDIESTAYTTIENQIKYFYALNENEKIKQEARETEIKYNTQREIFTNLNHSIKNLVGSVSKTLSRTKEEHELSTQVRRLINRASLGANLISAIANAISYSYRDDGDKWKEDLNPTYAAESLPRIIQCALFHAVPNILSGENIRLYSYEYNSYFPTQQEQEQAEVLWYQAYSDELKLNWINQNLFPMKFNIDQSVQSLRIGDKYSTFTHFFIFFNEIFLNTIKAVANVEKMLRKCDINIRVINHCISFELKNSSCSNQIQEKNGFGHIIIENYCKKFEIKDFKETYDTEGKMYQLHFQLPIILKEGEK